MKYKMRIRTKILTVFLLLVGIVSLSLLFSQYYFSEKIAIKSTSDTFNLISKNISEHLRIKAEDTKGLVLDSSKHIELNKKISFDIYHPALHSLIQVLQFKKMLHAIYFAQDDGRYFEVINMHKRMNMEKHFDAPKGTRWTVVITIDNVQQNVFLDEALTVLGKKKLDTQYDPRTRPWYKSAVKAQGRVVTTEPYLFVFADKMGVTYARVTENGKTVLGVDYTLDQLNEILANQSVQKSSEVFIVNKNGERYASSLWTEKDLTEIKKSVVKEKIFDQKYFQRVIAEDLNSVIEYQENGKNYFMIFHPLLNNNAYLGIKLDADLLRKAYRDNIRYSFLIAFLLLLLSIPIILFAVNSIVKPIHALIGVNHQIQERSLVEVKGIQTNIVELQELSDSLVSMFQSILAHEKSQEALLDSIIKLIAEAIDRKSPYTGKHCERVPEIAKMLLEEVNNSKNNVFKKFSLKDKEALRTFEIASWLHDCGKVTTPEYVVDKSVKLETIYNRIHEIRMRFEVVWRDLQISQLKGELDEIQLKQEQKKLLDDFAFIASVNLGSEYMSEEKKARVREIAQREWIEHFDAYLGLGSEELARYNKEEHDTLPATRKLLSDRISHLVARPNFDATAYAEEGFKMEVPEYLYNYGEIYNLCIEKGTLTKEERYKINEHVIMSIRMLKNIPFPKSLEKVPEYAGAHHETLIGTGYPKKLFKEELSIPARIMAIADIFEALTASDRPYKKAKTLSEAIMIMSKMVEEEHIDKDLFRLFIESGIPLRYAKKHLASSQYDMVEFERDLDQN